MGNASGSLRRKFGIVCLAVAGLMLALGLTALKSSLEGKAFLLYWFVCFVCTFGAIFIALADMRAVREHTKEETRELLEQTLRDVEQQA